MFPQPFARVLRFLGVIALVALATSACGDEEASGDVGTESPSTTTESTPPESTDPAAEADEELEEARQVAIDFIDALGQGDIDTARSLVGPVSEERAEDAGGLDSLLQQSTEGHGAWAGAVDRNVTPVGLEEGLVAVAMEGTLTIEGNTEHRVEVFPVRKAISTDAWFIEPWAYELAAGQPLGVTSPVVDEEEQAEVSADEPFDVTVQASESGTLYTSFAAAAPASDEVSADEPVTHRAPTAGDQLVVVAIEADPTIAAIGFRASAADSSTPPGDGGGTNEEAWHATHIEPEPGLEQTTRSDPIALIETGDPLRPVVVFWMGTTECYGLDRVEVTESDTEINIEVVVGRRPPVDQACIAIANRHSIQIELSAPIGDRTVVGTAAE